MEYTIAMVPVSIVPGVVAGYRNHRHPYLVNWLAFTGLGWIPALIWAFKGKGKGATK